MLITYCNLLIPFGILFPGIIGTFAENNELSSDIQIRKKRVIHYGGEEESLIRIEEAPYVVNILRHGTLVCIGTILMPSVIITVAHCVEFAITQYEIFSGSHILGQGSRHNISNKIVHENYDSRFFENDLALLEIYPFIQTNSRSHKIQLFQGVIEPRQNALVVGWGCDLHSGQNHHLLRKIYVPLLRYKRCENIYRNQFHITEKHICTFDPTGNKRCGVGDFGAPLVVHNKLLGMYIWSASIVDEMNKPDVFIYLSHIDYKQWIVTKLHGLGLNLRSIYSSN